MSTRIMGSAFRSEPCPECGETRSDSGPNEPDAAIVRHRWKEHHMSILTEAWDQIDAQVDEIMELVAKVDTTTNARPDYDGPTRAEYEVSIAKARARGKAEILALLMRPFFTTADEIATEATRRWQVRQAGGVPETKGISLVHEMAAKR